MTVFSKKRCTVLLQQVVIWNKKGDRVTCIEMNCEYVAKVV